MYKINPNHLLTFAIVARFKSITQAAQFLHLGQPAISGQLKLLQNTVGEPLYERKGHQISLTPVGEGLLTYAKKMESNLQQTSEYIRQLQKVNTGILRIGSTMTIASYYLPHYVVQLQTRHKGVQVFMKTGNTQELLKNLLNSDSDLAFIEGLIDKELLLSNYQIIPWQQDEIVMVLPENHPLTHQHPDYVPLDVFKQHPIIWRETGSGARQVVEQALAKANIEASVNIEVTGVDAIKESVRVGLGIGFASSLALRHESKGLIARHIGSELGLLWHLNIIAPKQEIQSRTVKAFLELCHQ